MTRTHALSTPHRSIPRGWIIVSLTIASWGLVALLVKLAGWSVGLMLQ